MGTSASMNHTDAYLTLTNTDPMTRLPLMTSVGAHEMLRNATHHGISTAAGHLGQLVTVTSSDGVFFTIKAPGVQAPLFAELTEDELVELYVRIKSGRDFAWTSRGISADDRYRVCTEASDIMTALHVENANR